MPEYLIYTADEAAKVLRVAKQTLARWRCEGKGPAFIKIGGRAGYKSSDLDAYIAGRRAFATSQRHEVA